MVNLGPTLLMSQQITSHPGLGDWRLFIEKKKKNRGRETMFRYIRFWCVEFEATV